MIPSFPWIKFCHLATSLQAFYVREKNPFDEIEDFVDRTAKAYDLDMTKLEGPMKGALRKLLDDKPSLKACVLGTRNGDPGSEYQGRV